MSKNVAKILALLLATMLLLSSCGGGGSSSSDSTAPQDSSPSPSTAAPSQASPSETAPPEAGGVTEINYVHLGDWAGPYLEEAAKDFEAETGIKVNIQLWPFMDGYEKYNTVINGKTMPDAGMGFGEWAAEFYERGAIVPVDPYISAEYKADLYDSAVEAGTYNGMMLGVPFITSVRTPIYRSDIFADNNLEAPTTTDKLLAACQALYNPPSMYGYGLCAARNKNTTEFFLELFWPMGGEVMNADGKTVAFNSPEGIAAMELMYQLAQTAPEGYQTSDIYLGENTFGAGNLAVMINAGWIVSSLQESVPDAQATALPYIEGPNGDKGNLYVADLIYVFNNGDDARAKAAMQWVEFFKSDEKYLGSSYIDFGLPPDLKSQANWAFMQSETAQLLGQAIEVGRSRPITPVWSQIDDAISVAVGKVCAGEATPADALAEAEKTCNEALANM